VRLPIPPASRLVIASSFVGVDHRVATATDPAHGLAIDALARGPRRRKRLTAWTSALICRAAGNAVDLALSWDVVFFEPSEFNPWPRETGLSTDCLFLR
jgi:hypothetical protein